MSDMFDVPQEFSDALKQGMAQETGVKLPFPAPLLWWGNGTAQNKALAKATPALYYGGWIVEEEHLNDAAQQYGEAPGYLVQTDFINRNGDSIPSYSARSIVFAPLSYRVAWVPKRENREFGQRYTSYQQGTAMHIQMLVLLASPTPDKLYKPWGPAVLSAKSFQAGNLLDAVKAWPKVIAPILNQAGSKAPASAFWMCAGTAGEFAQKMVGKNGAQSPITPIILVQPSKVDLDLLKKLFVGKETVAKMTDYIAQAAEWLDAWKHPQAAPAGVPEPEWNEPPVEDSIPF